jgi:hypothetical protein
LKLFTREIQFLKQAVKASQIHQIYLYKALLETRVVAEETFLHRKNNQQNQTLPAKYKIMLPNKNHLR